MSIDTYDRPRTRFPVRRDGDQPLRVEDNLVDDIRRLGNRGRDEHTDTRLTLEQTKAIPDPVMVIGLKGYYLYSFSRKRRGLLCKTREEALSCEP